VGGRREKSDLSENISSDDYLFSLWQPYGILESEVLL